MARLERPFGQLTWQIRWVERDASGKRHWRSKTTGTRDRDEAQKMLELFEDARRKRLDRRRVAEILKTAGEKDIPEDVLLESLWDWYAGHCDVSGADRQRRDRRNALNRFISWLWSAHPELKTVREVTLKIAAEYWKSMEERNLSPSARNNNLSFLNAVWSEIHAPMELESNPWAAIRRDRGGSVRYLPFSAEELEGLRREAAKFPSAMAEEGFWPAAVEMGYYTGLRLGDIASLDWSEVMDDGEFLVLLPNKVKRMGDDRVAVHSKSLPWVSMLPPARESGPVWPKAAASMASNNLSREFTAIALLAGIRLDRETAEGERRTGTVRLKTFHSLRHTFATEALKRGVSQEELKEQGNWASVAVIDDHYNHAKLEQAKKAAARIADVMRGDA